MYYKGATTGKAIMKEILNDIPMAIGILVLLYFTFQGFWDFLFNILTGRTSLIYFYN